MYMKSKIDPEILKKIVKSPITIKEALKNVPETSKEPTTVDSLVEKLVEKRLKTLK